MRRIAIVTSNRAEYGLLAPIMRAVRACADLELTILVTGAHLSEAHGRTERQIEADGFTISARIDQLVSGDSAAAVAKSIGLGTIGFADLFAGERPDLVVVLGDRTEILSVAIAALTFSIPLAHIHGGERTEGAMDEAVRHALTKMSHLHFVATEEYARRVIQLGEESWRVLVSGAPGLDNLRGFVPSTAEDLRATLDLPSPENFLLVTFHPATLESEPTDKQAAVLCAALDEVGIPVVFSHPNTDVGNGAIVRAIEQYVEMHGDARAVVSLGTQLYFSLMSRARAMVGNSSSGIIEAASFRLPVVNIGTRQQGRLRGGNVVDVPSNQEAIVAGIRHACDPGFRAHLSSANPYGDGGAADRIVERLRTTPLDRRLMIKRFVDCPVDLTASLTDVKKQGAAS
jgi:GDP/UDP-N,N'-diacetylbacillosamine 2-epimerase (hydrolysing)